MKKGLDLTKKRLPEKTKQDLRFVKVTVGSLHGCHDSEEQRSVRSHVMRDYLRQIKEPLPTPTPLSMAPDISQHIGRFRSVTKPRHGGRTRVRVEYEQDSRSHVKRAQKFRVIKPSSETVPLAEATPIDPALRNFRWKKSPLVLPIDISWPDTSDLIEYYHTSFWANSFAVNPEGRWLPIAMSDPAMLHATLSLVAQHRAAMTAKALPRSYFRHRGEAMRIISSRLGDADQAISDATIAAVAILANADNHSLWTADVHESHIRGLTTLVDLRGGLDGLQTNIQIKRVVAWADLLHASAHDQDLHFKDCEMIVDTAPLEKFVASKVPALAIADIGTLDVPSRVATICRQLQMLGAAKTSLVLDRNSAACELFSTMLYKTERAILTLSPKTVSEDEEYNLGNIWSSWPIYRAIRAASLIHTFHTLRDLPISAAFFESLASRLRHNLNIVVNQIFEQVSLKSFPDDPREPDGSPQSILDDYIDPSLLLNLLMNGWKASVRDLEDRNWFRDQAQQICWMYQIETKEDFCSRVMKAMFSKEYCPTVARAFWTEIQP